MSDKTLKHLRMEIARRTGLNATHDDGYVRSDASDQIESALDAYLKAALESEPSEAMTAIGSEWSRWCNTEEAGKCFRAMTRQLLKELADEKTVNRRYSGCACTIEVRDGEEIIAGWCLVHAEVRRRAEDAEAALGAAEVLSTK